MGSIISAHCDCGYEKGEMFLGGGMMNFTTQCNFPHYCEECKILFEANLFEKERFCPECGKEKVISYDDVKGDVGSKTTYDARNRFNMVHYKMFLFA